MEDRYQTELRAGIQDWLDDLQTAVEFEDTSSSLEILSAILKVCQEKELDQNILLAPLQSKLKEKIKGSFKPQYSERYNYTLGKYSTESVFDEITEGL